MILRVFLHAFMIRFKTNLPCILSKVYILGNETLLCFVIMFSILPMCGAIAHLPTLEEHKLHPNPQSISLMSLGRLNPLSHAQVIDAPFNQTEIVYGCP